MSNKLEIYKKRLIYRASYRGTKEMDILLSKFVNKYIDEFDEKLLTELEKFLNYEDEVLLNYYHLSRSYPNLFLRYVYLTKKVDV